MVRCGSMIKLQKDTCLKEIGFTCSKYDNHSKLNNQHDLGRGEGLYDHLRGMKIFTFNNECDIYVSSKNYEESRYNLDLDLQTIS